MIQFIILQSQYVIMELGDLLKSDWKNISKHILILFLISWLIGGILGLFLKSSIGLGLLLDAAGSYALIPLIWFLVFTVALPMIYSFIFINNDSPLKNVILISMIFTISTALIFFFFNVYAYYPVVQEAWRNGMEAPVYLENLESMLSANPVTGLSPIMCPINNILLGISCAFSTEMKIAAALLIHLGLFSLGFLLNKRFRGVASPARKEN